MKLELTTTLTKKDKMLLTLLAIILVLVVFNFRVIGPLLHSYHEKKEQLKVEEQSQTASEKKMQQYDSLQIYLSDMQTKVKEDKAKFYTMMTSEEIDKFLTDLAVGYGLKAKDLTIEESVPVSVGPYLFSEKAKENGVETNYTQEDGDTVAKIRFGMEENTADTGAITEVTTEATTEQMMEGDSEATVEENAQDAQYGLFCSTVTMKVNGTKSQINTMLNRLTNHYDAIRVTGYQLEDEYEIGSDQNLNPTIKTEKAMTLNLELYMYKEREEK